MTTKISLRLSGLDLRHPDAYECIPDDLVELSYEAHAGISLAVVYSDDPSPAAEAADWARRIAKRIPGVSVTEVYDELVSVSDIAARVDVAPEAVRLWAAGKRRASSLPFPEPRQVVGTGSGTKAMSLYLWRHVVQWVREVLGIDPDEDIVYLDDRQVAQLSAELADQGATDWCPLGVSAERLTSAMPEPVPIVRADVARFLSVAEEVLNDVSVPVKTGTLRLALR